MLSQENPYDRLVVYFPNSTISVAQFALFLEIQKLLSTQSFSGPRLRLAILEICPMTSSLFRHLLSIKRCVNQRQYSDSEMNDLLKKEQSLSLEFPGETFCSTCVIGGLKSIRAGC